jgi:hypothetical protein
LVAAADVALFRAKQEGRNRARRAGCDMEAMRSLDHELIVASR